jgi:hypothetical protein
LGKGKISNIKNQKEKCTVRHPKEDKIDEALRAVIQTDFSATVEMTIMSIRDFW